MTEKTLRDDIAIEAMKAIRQDKEAMELFKVQFRNCGNTLTVSDMIAKCAYRQADAMMKAREVTE